MKKEINRCMGCMSEKLYEGPCEVCGYDESADQPSQWLAPKTFLADRYVLGRVIQCGGEGAAYIAFDTKLGLTVEIREFMPDMLCRRGADGESVEVVDGALPLFKSYLSEFADLHKSLMSGFEGGGLKKTYDIFAANGTGYVVTEHVNGVPLEEYIASRGGKLSWGEAGRLMQPLMDTLTALHDKGIVHRGLSPETILITPDGRTVLTSLEISAARTADSSISSDIYDNYAAPEQYDLSERQGSWTDVYAMSAVLYRALTGSVPPSANDRKGGAALTPAHTAEPDIPVQVSDAINAGMKLPRAERAHDIGTLRAMLSDEPEQPEVPDASDENDGPITPEVHVRFDIEDHEQHRISEAKKKRRKQEERRNIGTAAGLIIFLAMVAALVICIIYFSENAQDIQRNAITAVSTESTPPEVTEETPRITTAATTDAPEVTEVTAEKLIMPDLVNRFYNTSLQNRYSMLIFEVEEEYSDEYAESLIMEQDIQSGTQVTAGTTVHLKVSKGAAYTYLPDYVGMKLSEYTNKLTILGVRFRTEEEETNEVKKGYVVRCSKNVGDKVYISENEEIVVYYAKAPAATTPPETEPLVETAEIEIPVDGEDTDDEIPIDIEG